MKNVIKKFLFKWTNPKPSYAGMSADELAGILENKIKDFYKDQAVESEMDKLDDEQAKLNDEMEIERQIADEEDENLSN